MVPDGTSNNEIVVTEAYRDMYYRILDLRKQSVGRKGGIVLAGQPGVGASL